MNQDETETLIYKIIYDAINRNDFIKEHFRFVPDEIKLKIISIDFKTDTFFDNNIYKYPYDYNNNKYEFGMGGFYDITFEYEGILNDKKNWRNFGVFEKERIKSEFFRIFKTELISTSRDYKLKSLNLTMEDKIKNRIDEYLEFDSSELFKNKDRGHLVKIFGGAVRDSISGDPINDIDILCGSKAIRPIEYILEANGYKYMESLTPKDLASIYSDIHVINEPHTWIKGNKVVQLIRPSIWKDIKERVDGETYKEGFEDLIANVDISSCGLSYDGILYENYKNAIIHCQQRVFSVNKKAKMYSHKRISHRIGKFIDRGWTEIDDTILNNRDLKLDNILYE